MSNSFFSGTTRLWNSLPIECFPLAYDLISFKSRINPHSGCSALPGVNPNLKKNRKVTSLTDCKLKCFECP